MAINWFKYSSPSSFYSLAGKMIPLFTVVAILLAIAGLYIGFFVAPTDFQQGEAYRIIFIHVPAAWMSMFLYLVMAFWAAHDAKGRQIRPLPGRDYQQTLYHMLEAVFQYRFWYRFFQSIRLCLYVCL